MRRSLLVALLLTLPAPSRPQAPAPCAAADFAKGRCDAIDPAAPGVELRGLRLPSGAQAQRFDRERPPPQAGDAYAAWGDPSAAGQAAGAGASPPPVSPGGVPSIRPLSRRPAVNVPLLTF